MNWLYDVRRQVAEQRLVEHLRAAEPCQENAHQQQRRAPGLRGTTASAARRRRASSGCRGRFRAGGSVHRARRRPPGRPARSPQPVETRSAARCSRTTARSGTGRPEDRSGRGKSRGSASSEKSSQPLARASVKSLKPILRIDGIVEALARAADNVQLGHDRASLKQVQIEASARTAKGRRLSPRPD